MPSHHTRLKTCISGGSPDRAPVALWRHFPVDDQEPSTLAAAITAYQRTFDFDLIKVTPASSFCLRDWGAEDEWKGAAEGTREYQSPRVISRPEDWRSLPVLDPNTGSLAAQLRCLEILVDEFKGDVPLIQTIFNPLSQAKNLVGREALIHHLRRAPEALQEGLETIAETTKLFIQAAKETGIDGIFYAVQHAQDTLLTESEYLAFGRAYDLKVLGPAEDLWLNMLHIHGTEIMFDIFVDYPVAIFNWHDQETSPTLKEALEKISGAVCGGLDRSMDLVLGTPERIRNKAAKAFQETGGKRLILGTGCVTHTNAPYGNILAARQAVELESPTR